MLSDVGMVNSYPECLWHQRMLTWVVKHGMVPFHVPEVFRPVDFSMQAHVFFRDTWHHPYIDISSYFLWKTFLLPLFLYFLWSASCTLAIWVLKPWKLCKTKTGQWYKSHAALHWKQGQRQFLRGSMIPSINFTLQTILHYSFWNGYCMLFLSLVATWDDSNLTAREGAQ